PIFRDLKKKVKVEPVRDTELFAINVSAFTAKDAARIANVVSRSYCIFDLEQQLAELKQQYGEKHLTVVQLQNNIDKLSQNLTGESLPNIDAIGPASVKIIEQAVEPPEPAGKSKALILILAFIFSIMFGIVLAFAFDYFDSTLKSPQEVKSFLTMPYLGYVPHVRSMPGSSVILVKRAINAAAVVACAMIAIYGVLTIMGVDPANPIFMVISIVSVPVASLTDRVPLGHLIVPVILVVGIIIANKYISQLLDQLEKQASKSSTKLKDFRKMSDYIQAFRNLTHQLYLSLKGNEHTSVLFTSSLAQEGVSTVLANLARYLAVSSGKKVLVIDANTRDPNMHKLFRLNNAKGLADVLEANASLDDAVQKAQEGLFVLCSGAQTQSAFDLPDTMMFSKLIEEAEKKYEIVLIDCPSLKDYKDSVSLSAYVSGVVLVVSEGMARREVLKAALSGLEQKKAHFIGVILNNRTFAIPNMIYKRA
ncbi:MAG: polysaccharide biosynthesis tyrosine autokinase, partial [Candidatus Omnitrophica bacterium]|nr:polysaccharide biosynthesis tyrosine autokinase [Candidatus Omnitrophota bacterium]